MWGGTWFWLWVERLGVFLDCHPKDDREAIPTRGKGMQANNFDKRFTIF